MGIESSAHTFGVGISSGKKILANEREMYKITNAGIIPTKVADFHAENCFSVIKRALDKSGLKIDEIDAIGYTKGPGIGPCLRVGELAALSIAKKHKIPIYPVNHGVAHIEIAKELGKLKDPIALYVSGGNSQILAIVNEGYKHYHVFGETLDVGIGNMLDSFARAAKMNPAWGSSVEKAAVGGRYLEMPYTVKGMDFTFTGLLTKATEMLATNKIGDVAYSMQETAFSMLCEATERALFLTGKRELVVCGGVAQSGRLRSMLGNIARSHNFSFYSAPNEFNADNGAMIALVAGKMHDSGVSPSPRDYGIKQRYRIDSFKISW